MKEAAVRAAVSLMGGKCQREPPNNEGWMSVSCPFSAYTHESGQDRNPSMRVRVRDGGLSAWKCWSCNEGGSDLLAVLYKLQAYQADLPYAQLVEIATGESDELVFPSFEDIGKAAEPAPVLPEEWLTNFPYATSIQTSHDYLKGRAVSDKEAAVWDLRWDYSKQRVCFPIRDFGGAFRGIQGRTIHKDLKPKYLHYPYKGEAPRGSEFWLGENRIDLDKPVVIVEGGFDALSVWPVYSNVIAVMGAASVLSPEKLDRIATAITVAPFFDGNDAGKTGLEVVRKWCWRKRLCRPVKAPAGRDPGEMHPDEIGELLGEALAGTPGFN